MNAKQKFWGMLSAITATFGIAGTTGLVTFQMLTTAASEGGMGLVMTGIPALIGVGAATGVSLLLAIPLVAVFYNFYVKKRDGLINKRNEETKKKNEKEAELNDEVYNLAINLIRLKCQQDKDFLDKNDKLVIDPSIFANIKLSNDITAKKAIIDRKLKFELEDLVNSICDKLRQDKLPDAKGAGLNTFTLWKTYCTDPSQTNIKTLRDELKKDDKIVKAFDSFKNGCDESQKLIIPPKIKPQLSDSIIEGGFGVFGFLSTFASVLGPSFTASSLVTGTAASVGTILAATPIIGWGILGGAVLLSLAVGCAYAYYIHQNNRIKTDITGIRNETKQIENLQDVVHAYDMKVKHEYENIELQTLRQVKTNADFERLEDTLQQVRLEKLKAEHEKTQALALAGKESERANAEHVRANVADARVAIAESQVASAHAELTRTQAESAELRNQFNGANAELSRVQAESVALRNQFDHANDELARTKAESTTLRNQVDNTNAELAREQAESAELRKQLAAAQEALKMKALGSSSEAAQSSAIGGRKGKEKENLSIIGFFGKKPKDIKTVGVGPVPKMNQG